MVYTTLVKHAVGSDYREFPVPAQLANHFLCFWTQAIVDCQEYAHQVLPDACIDIVLRMNNVPPRADLLSRRH